MAGLQKAHYFIEGNTSGEYLEGSGDWVNVTEHVVGQGATVSFNVKGSMGQIVVSPPSSLKVDNNDNWWTSEPELSSSALYGRLEGRRFQIRLEKSNASPVTLGTFRIKTDGLKLRRDGTGELKLEALTKRLEDADASGVKYGLGWYQAIPWTLAMSKILEGEATAEVANYPECVLAYNYIDKGISLLGRAGDYRGTGDWNWVDDVVVDVCWNSEASKFCFATSQSLYEWDPATGAYNTVTINGQVTDGENDILRIWFKPWNGDGFYFILAAPKRYASQTIYSGYWQPKDQAYNQCYGQDCELWASDHYVKLCDLGHIYGYGAQLAPVIYRDTCLDASSSLRDEFNIGNESNFYDTQDRYYENIVVPFGQYVAVLFNRRDQSGEVPGSGNDIESQDISYYTPDPDRQDPVYAYNVDADNAYQLLPREGAGARQKFNMDQLRMGRGYYSSLTTTTSNFDPDEAWDAGARVGFGQGPLVDISWPDYGDGSSNGRWDCWVGWMSEDGGYWKFICKKVYNPSGTSLYTYYASQDILNAAHAYQHRVVPTFLVMDLKRNENWSGGCVIIGWYNYKTDATWEFVDPAAGGGGYKVRPAESGIELILPGTGDLPHNAAPTLSRIYDRFITFTPGTDGHGSTYYNRYYWSTLPSYGSPGVVHDPLGRFTPVAAGIQRTRVASGEQVIRLICSGLDRSECLTDPVTQRNGEPYRILVFVIHVWSSSVNLYFNDSLGAGHDTGWRSSLPPMGFTRLLAASEAEQNAWDSWDIFFYNPSDRGLYSCDMEDSTWRPQLRGHVPASDPYMGMGMLANSDPGGDDPQVAGSTMPVFPLTGDTRWPIGEYYGWLWGPTHSGRIPLLDLTDLKKWRALGLISQLADVQYYLDRNGVAKVEQVPLQAAATPLLELTPSDYADGDRSRTQVSNYATRSINDVMPGDLSVTIRLTPKSEWNLSPGFSGMGLYAVNLELMCIAGGMVSEVVSEELQMGRTNWGWRETGSRMESRVNQTSTSTVLYMDGPETVDVGDFVTLGIDDQDIEITSIVGGNFIFLRRALSREYKPGDRVWITKRSQSMWSHQLVWDEDASKWRGVGMVATGAASGTSLLAVRDMHPFSEGCIISIGDNTVSTGPLRVIRIRTYEEEHEQGYDYLEVEQLGGGGLPRAITGGEPIATWLNIGPKSRSIVIGQTGVLFTIHGGAGGTANDNTEKPLHEGDRILVSYPGLITRKNSKSKVTAQDFDSSRQHGLEKAKMVANKFRDYNLALMDVQRTVSRGAEGRLLLELEGVDKADGLIYDTDFLNPMDVVRVTDDRLLYDRDSYTSKFMVVKQSKSVDQPGCSLSLEELPSATQGRASVAAAWTPAQLDNLELWFTAKRMYQEGARDGQDVPVWFDQSGNSRHAYQQVAGTSPVPSMSLVGDDSDIPVIRFDSSAQERLVVGDVEVHSNSAGRGLWISVIGHKMSSGDSHLGEYISKYETFPAGREWFMRCYYFSVQDSAASYDANTVADHQGNEDWHWLMGVWDVDTGAVKGYRDGTLMDTAPTAVTDITDSASYVTLGAERAGTTNNLNGEVAEIIVTSKPPTSTDLDNLAAYIASQPYAALISGVFGAFSSGFSDGFE